MFRVFPVFRGQNNLNNLYMRRAFEFIAYSLVDSKSTGYTAVQRWTHAAAVLNILIIFAQQNDFCGNTLGIHRFIYNALI